MAVVDCAFQQSAFQNNAFQVCIPIPPVPPAPIVAIERRWPGPSILLYSEDMYWQRQRREEEEIIIL